MKHVENRIFLNSDDLFIGTQISFYHRENLDTGANHSMLLPKYLYIFFFLLLFCVHVCTTVHIVHVQFTTFSLWFFLLRKSKTSKNRNRKYFLWVFFCQLLFSEQARNMFISNHHPMACMSMTSQMMIIFCFIYDCIPFSHSESFFLDLFYFLFVYSLFIVVLFIFFSLSLVRLFYLIIQLFVVIYLLFTLRHLASVRKRKNLYINIMKNCLSCEDATLEK